MVSFISKPVFSSSAFPPPPMVIELKDVTQLDTGLVDTFLEKGLPGNELIEKVQQVSLPYAELKSKEWYFDGIRIGYAEWQYREPSVVEWEFDTKFHIITLYFNLKGRTKTGYGERTNGKAFELGNYQHNLFYAPFSKGELRNEDLRLTTFMIQFSLPAFLGLAQNANDALQRFCENVGRGGRWRCPMGICTWMPACTGPLRPSSRAGTPAG